MKSNIQTPSRPLEDVSDDKAVVIPSFLRGNRKEVLATIASPSSIDQRIMPSTTENIEAIAKDILNHNADELNPGKVEVGFPSSEPEENAEDTAEDIPLIQDSERIIGSKILRQMIPLSMMQIWRLEQLGRFPVRIQISSKKVGWNLLEIKQHIAGLPRGSNSNSAPQPKIGGKNAK